jgi:outer membrane autotransporter protein
MDQLTGAEHAQHLRSVLWSTRAINRIITERMECDGENVYARSASATSGAKVGNNTVMPTADAPMATGCFEPGTASIWMRGFGQWNTLDGDENAPGYDETQYGFIFGGDYAFDENWFVGVAGGYFDSDGDFDDWGGRTGTDYDYDGLQLAAYGGYDNSTYYLRGVISYGNYDGESNRMIAFNGSPIDPKGDPSSDTWSFYGETGYRFGVTDYANLTPFAGLSLATANLDSFTEDDPEGTGAALEVHDSDADSVASVLGVRFDADMVAGGGVFTPMVSVAWMHEFGDTPEVDVSFAGAPSGADFTVEASDVGRDSILIDAGAKYDLNGSVNFGLFYNGQFNEDYSSNAITARLGYKF